MLILQLHIFAPDGSYFYNEDSMVSNIVITDFGMHYVSYIIGMHVRASFLAFSYLLSTINCHA